MKKGVLANMHRFADENLAVVEVVVVADKLRIGSNHCAVLNGDAAAIRRGDRYPNCRGNVTNGKKGNPQ